MLMSAMTMVGADVGIKFSLLKFCPPDHIWVILIGFPTKFASIPSHQLKYP
jgi:hypothetical protein